MANIVKVKYLPDRHSARQTKPKRKAKDNPWYRLATLHGNPSFARRARAGGAEIAAKNRVTWNRWMASHITDDLKAHLLESGYSAEELTPFSEDERRDIQSKIGVDAAVGVRGVIDFSVTEFEDHFFADGFIVIPGVDFANATFSRNTSFNGATFIGGANFYRATFSGGVANFHKATFSGGIADFRETTFSGTATFDSATFSGGSAVFDSGIFGSANFRRATFISSVFFRSAIFIGDASFDSATFSDYALFINAEMKSLTSFTASEFTFAPELFGAKLHEGTVWRGVVWPRMPRDVWTAGNFVEAYERLKLEMDRLKKHGDELDFFARELQCRRVLLGFWRGLPIAAYGALCGLRPILAAPAGDPYHHCHVGSCSHPSPFWR